MTASHAPHSAPIVRLAAVVVTFHPAKEALAHLWQTAPAFHRLYVVDNTPAGTVSPVAWPKSPDSEESGGTGHVHVLSQKGNLGLAHALNRGVRAAMEGGASHVLLLDQDSSLPAGLVPQLVEAWQIAAAQSVAVGAIGPAFSDDRGGTPLPHAQFRLGLGYRPAPPWGADGRFNTPYMLITSGTVISVSAWQAVGPFREDFFIDNIDLEWSFRATHAGYLLLGCPWLTMPHQLGHHRVSVPGLSRPLITHPPQRLYYIMRNRLLMYRMPHVPRAWVVRDALRLLPKFVLTTLFVSPRLAGLRAMLQGLWHGLLGRTGARPD